MKFMIGLADSNVTLKTHECKQCGKTYASNSGLIHHRDRIHEKKQWKCDVCSKEFATERYLKHHF